MVARTLGIAYPCRATGGGQRVEPPAVEGVRDSDRQATDASREWQSDFLRVRLTMVIIAVGRRHLPTKLGLVGGLSPLPPRCLVPDSFPFQDDLLAHASLVT